ncbi:MAG: glycoside hydrolase family 43 protein [Eubacterium sp.]|nr:glycoside hydrolase family 43 protein [Eubacterium sp.]
MSYYLFCYFTGNEPEKERICLAVSRDGQHFCPLNGGKPIIKQTAGTGCCRDPFILRDERGGYYIVATDMQSSLGWCSNHGVVSWHSDDLLHWTDECAVDFHQFTATRNTDRIWAPEALYDRERDAYFVYYSVYNVGGVLPLSIWYSYTTDFRSFTEPQPLFAPSNGLDAIDADIIEKDGKYYMYYKDEYHKTICCVEADSLTGPYREYEGNQVACTDRNVEGNCIYPLVGTDTYIMMMDMYSDGRYFMQKTTDMRHFEPVEDFDLSFHPRHGSVLVITQAEYERLVQYYEG